MPKVFGPLLLRRALSMRWLKTLLSRLYDSGSLEAVPQHLASGCEVGCRVDT